MIEQHNKSMHFRAVSAGKLYPSAAENNSSVCNYTRDMALNCNTSLPLLAKHKRIRGNSNLKKENDQTLGKTDIQGEIKSLKYIPYLINN